VSIEAPVVDRGASFADWSPGDAKYRLRLHRTWDPAVLPATFVMLNPSTADAEQDDPPIRRCIGFARRWGFGGVRIVNLFALRATNPRALYTADRAGVDSIGPENGAAIIIDAALETGIYDREGNRLIPPRYFDAPAYQATIRKLQALRPEHLLTAHYPPMRGEEALDFLDRSLQFTHQVHGVVREGLGEGITDLRELTGRVDERLGPYPEFAHELAAGVRAHMAVL